MGNKLVAITLPALYQQGIHGKTDAYLTLFTLP